MDRPPSRVQKGTFGVLFAAAAFFFLWTVSPIWVPVFLGVLLAVVATPLQRRLERRVPRHPRLLAAGITAVTLSLGSGVVAFIAFVVIRQLLRFLSDGSAQDYAMAGMQRIHSHAVTSLLARFGETPDLFIGLLKSHGAQLSEHLTAVLGSVLSVTSNGMVTLLFTAVTSYYLLLEGPALKRFMLRLLPLPAEETRALMHEFREATVGIALGIGVISAYQAVTAGLGFWAFGVSQPLVWGAVTGVVSLLPAVGTALTCVPIAVILMVSGHLGAGIALLVYWAVVVVVIADYGLRPWIMKGRMRLHSLLVLLSLFGGLEAFGPLGLALGPLICALFVALLRIYDRDYRPRQPQNLASA